MTARGELSSMATANHGWTAAEANDALDRYRAEVLAEGRELIGAASEARLDAIDEDDRDPSDWDRHHAWLDAADVLKNAAQGAGQ